MNNDSTRVIKFGKFIGILYPDVYFQFVSTLMREHDDLVRGMVLAKVQLKDGSALDYLNLMLGTAVSLETPMEVGYAQLLDALKMRVHTSQTEKDAERVAREMFSQNIPTTRTELPGGKLFPEWDDLDEHKQH